MRRGSMRRGMALPMLVAAACSGTFRFDPSPSCSARNEPSEDGGMERGGAPSTPGLGQRHACAMDGERDARCWGGNDLGQLLSGSTIPPGQSRLFDEWRGEATLVVGGAHACAFTEDDLECWGNNARGQLADGTKMPRRGLFEIEIEPLGLSAIEAGAAGLLHTCVTDGSDVVCFGDNAYGQLGHEGDAPARVEGLPERTVTDLVAGAFHTCAVLELDPVNAIQSSDVWCWGDDRFGALGDGEPGGTQRMPTRVRFEQLLVVANVAAGAHHTCVALGAATTEHVERALYCWGRGASGEIGPALTASAVPVPVVLPFQPVGVTAGGVVSLEAEGDGVGVGDEGTAHTCAWSADGEAVCFGEGDSGQLGGGHIASSATPVWVGADRRWMRLAAGGAFTCGLGIAGPGERSPLYCWGDNAAGQLGRSGPSTALPDRVPFFAE